MHRKAFWKSIALSLTLCVVSAATNHATAQDADLLEYVRDGSHRHAYGMYLDGQKLGWYIEDLTLGEFEGKTVAIYEDDSYFSTEFFGETEESIRKLKVTYSLEGDGEILLLELDVNEDGRQSRIEARRVDDRMEVTTVIGEQTPSVRMTDVPKDSLRRALEFDEWLAGDRKPGDTFVDYTADFEEADINVMETYTFNQYREIKQDESPLKVADLGVDIMGGEATTVMTLEGDTLEFSFGGFIDMVPEDESQVREMSSARVDLFAASSIMIENDLGDPANVSRLVLKIENVENFTFPTSPRQQVEIEDDGAIILTTRQGFRYEEPQPLTDDELEEYLASTPATMCDHPSIIERSKRIVRDEADPLQKAYRIMRWVYRNLDAAGASNATTSVQVLEQRAGDCTEHSLLCVALARAAGIPAREVSGVMYGGEQSMFFAWHAWVKVHDGHQWVAIDPTWNQENVDATHLTFSHKTSDLSWTNVVGQLAVEVLDTEWLDDADK